MSDPMDDKFSLEAEWEAKDATPQNLPRTEDDTPNYLLKEMLQAATTRAEEAEKEVGRLKAWKESMISVMPPMQEIGKALALPLGSSIHDKILPKLAQLQARVEAYEMVLEAIRSGEYMPRMIADEVLNRTHKGESSR